MKSINPDIIITNAEGEYLVILQIKITQGLINSPTNQPHIFDALKATMVALNCPIGVLIINQDITILRDSFEQSNGDSISIANQATIKSLNIPEKDSYTTNYSLGAEFEDQVQKWFVQLQSESCPYEQQEEASKIFDPLTLSLIRGGEIRAGHPRLLDEVHA
jgi:hypothetical protein